MFGFVHIRPKVGLKQPSIFFLYRHYAVKEYRNNNTPNKNIYSNALTMKVEVYDYI